MVVHGKKARTRKGLGGVGGGRHGGRSAQGNPEGAFSET